MGFSTRESHKFQKGFLNKTALELEFKEQIELRIWKWAMAPCKWEKSWGKARGRKSWSRVSWLNDTYAEVNGGAEIEREWKSDGCIQ